MIFFSITVIMQFYCPKTPIDSVCQSSFPALPHGQYHLAYIHQPSLVTIRTIF